MSTPSIPTNLTDEEAETIINGVAPNICDKETLETLASHFGRTKADILINAFTPSPSH